MRLLHKPDGLATHMVRGRESEFKAFRRTMNGLARKMDRPLSAIDLLEISSEAVEALEAYSERTTEYLGEQNEYRQSMVAMLADTVADLSGQTDASVARLQSIEQQIERASGFEDMKALRTGLESCLQGLREAAAQQRTGSAATAQRLQAQIDTARQRIIQDRTPSRLGPVEIDLVPEPPDAQPEKASSSYVAVFKLQRAEHIATRFGESAKAQMLSFISRSLKTVLGPADRLLRWKGTAFVMFLSSTAPIQEVRALLSEAVASTGQHYIEVGRKSALLSIGVDWTVFPQDQCSSLDAVFTEVDSFLTNAKPSESVAWRGLR